MPNSSAHVPEDTVLRVTDVTVDYGSLRAVAGVSFEVSRGETLGIVGESGCGKSSLGRTLVHMPPASSGTVEYNNTALGRLSSSELRLARLEIQMVFQDPRSSLHPLRTVAQIVGEPLRIWRIGTKESRQRTVNETLLAVGLDPDVHGSRRAGTLSGGQCQRVAIARALVAGAKVLVCDEPISSLDVSLRATILNLLEDLKAQHDLTIVFIAHDLAAVRNVSDRIMVMYFGKAVEVGHSESIFEAPLHPYTRLLIASVPRIDNDSVAPVLIHGEPPSPHEVPSGCRFRTRCPLATVLCAEEEPELRELAPGRLVACHYAEAPVTASLR